MRYRRLGKSGIKVSVMGLGCMGMTHAYGAPSDETEMIKQIRLAAELGINFFDTAECYTGTDADGHIVYNEELVGRALAPIRDSVIIASKFGVSHAANGMLVKIGRAHV